jgi:PAS domain S-box-containing protein
MDNPNPTSPIENQLATYAVAPQVETAADIARERDMMHALSRVAQSVQQAHAPDQVYHAIGEGLESMAYHATVMILDEERKNLWLAYVSMRDALRRRAEKLLSLTLEEFCIEIEPGNFYHDILYDRKPRFFDSLLEPMSQSLPRIVKPIIRQLLTLLGFEHGIFAPMRLGGEPIGLFAVAGKDLRATDTTAIGAFATQAAIAIQNAQLYEELESANTRLERKVAQRTAELRRVKERVEAVLDNSPDAVLLLTPEGAIASTNPAFTEMFGYAADELYGRVPILLICPTCVDRFGQAMHEAKSGGGVQRLELKARRKDEVTFDASLALAPIMENGERIGMVCTLRDVTDTKELDRMKDEFVAFIAHELGTPLTSIRGYSELLLMRDLDAARQRRFLGMIQEQSTQLADLVDDLRDLSRLEAGGGLSVDPRPIGLGKIVHKAVEPFQETSPGHTLIADIAPDLPRVRGDSKRLAQVVRNLLSNAIKYSPEGGDVMVHVRGCGGAVEVSVEDEGIGIAPEHQAHLFEKFNRAGASDSGIEGTGLGLVICKRIVEAHGGWIDVESAPGAGSTFTFAIPVAA